jgi:sugar phosphate isomerase/epimerase
VELDNMKLGIDFWSLHSQGWDVLEHLEYAHRLGVDVVHSELYFFESLQEDYLGRVRARAEELGLVLETGMGSICPTSTAFPYLGWPGTAEEQLRRAMRAASAIGASVLRCLIGSRRERRTELPIEAHIEATVQTCSAVRDLALELGIMLAVENHAGDLQGRELKALVEAAGSEYVGVCLDSGGTLSTAAESPFVTLEHLAPYVVTSHIRDAVIWEHPRGAAVQSVAMGDGTIGMDEWARLFQERCPNATFNLEIITGSPPRVLNYLDPVFWQDYSDTPAWEFARFLGLVRQGHPFMGHMLMPARGETPQEYRAALVVQERLDLERSVRYCREVLKIGERVQHEA